MSAKSSTLPARSRGPASAGYRSRTWATPRPRSRRRIGSPRRLSRCSGGSYTDEDGESHTIEAADILVVTPYNAQVRCLEERLPDGVRVGTVDKFQGQQAQVVFFSMATSSPAELPRNLEFLFSRNRLNVAISRARCIACVVASPALLDTDCRTIEQMRLVNALCRVSEAAA